MKWARDAATDGWIIEVNANPGLTMHFTARGPACAFRADHAVLLEKLAAELEASYKEPVKWEDPWVYRPTEEYVPDRVEVDPVPECLKELFDEAKNPCDMPSAY